MEQEVESEDDDQQPIEVDNLQELADVQALTLGLEKGSVPSLEKDIISEGIPAGETVTFELKEVPLTEVSVEPENEDELETDAAKPEHVQVPDASEAEQASTLDSEEGSIQSPKEEVKSEDIPLVETVTDEPNLKAERLTKVSFEPENKELPANVMKTVQESEVFQDVQAPTSDSEEGSAQSLEKEVISDNDPEGETDEPKEETIPLTEANLEPVDASKTGHVQEPEVLEAVQVPTLDSEEDSVQSSKEEVKSEDISPAESVTDEPKQSAEVLTEVSIEPENKELPVNVMKTGQEPEVFQAVQAPTSDSAEGSVQSLEKEVISENIPEGETVTDEPNEETIPLTEANLEPVDASKTEHVQEPEVFEAVQAPTLDSEEGCVQSPKEEVKSEDISPAETVTDEPKQSAEVLTEVSIEPENKELPANAMKTVQAPEVLEDVQASTLDSKGSVQSLEKEVVSDNVPEGETHEPKEETIPLIEANLESVDGSKTGHVQEPEVFQAVQAPTSDSAEGSVQSLEKEVISENVPEGETVTDEPNEETIPLTETNLEPVDASKTEHVQEPEVFEAVQAPTLDSEEGCVQSPKEEVKSEDISPAETVTDEPKQSAEVLTEVSIEPENKELPANAMKTVQAPEVLEDVQASTLDSKGSVQSLEKEVVSDNVPEGETHEPKEETIPLIEANLESVDGSKTGHVQEPEVFEAVQAPPLDSEEGSIQSPKAEVKSEDISPAETVTDEPKQSAEVLTEVSIEQENKELPANAMKTVQAPTLYSEESSVQSLEKQVISQNVPEAETVPDEPKQTAEHHTEVSVEPVDASKTEKVQEPEVIQSVQAATLDSEEGIVQSLEKELIPEDVPEGETVTDEPKEETIPFTEANLEPVDSSRTGHVQEPQALQAEQAATLDSKAGILFSLEKEEISGDILVVGTVTDEPRQENEVEKEEKLPVEAAKTEYAQEPEVLPSDVKNHVTETNTDEGTSMCMHAVIESIEGGSAQEFEKQILLDDVPKPNIDSVIASVTDGFKGEGVAQLGPSLERAKDQETESITQDVGVEQEDCIPEVVDKLLTLTAVCVSSVNEEESNVQVLEKTVTEETPASCVDNAAVTNEPKHEVHLSAGQVSVEGEKESEFLGREIKTSAVEHALAAHVVICNIKDVSAAIPAVLIEKTSPITEILIERVTSELMFEEEVETAAPIVKDNKAETAEEGSVVVMMHVPSVEFEDNNRTQVQVVDDDIKSAETIVDTVVEVGETEAKEGIDVCQENVKKVDSLSTTPEIVEELINEQNKVTIQEVIQHVKKNLPETVPESLVVNLGQKGIEQPDAVTEVSEMVKSESIEVEDQKDSNASFHERQDETSTEISAVAATGQQVTEDLHTPDTTQCLDVSIHDQKDHLEETKAEEEKSEAGVVVEEVKSNQMIHKETQIIQTLIVTPTNTGVVAPEYTGVISSIGNVESPSSLSIEFKLNIQFGQANEPASPPATTERSEPVKKTEVSEVGVQAVEVEEPIKTTKQIELTEVAVQATGTTELVANLDSKERAVITTQPVLLDISFQAMEPDEQIKSTETVTSSVQATETKQPVRQTEKTEESLSQPVLSEACEQETKVKEPAKQKELDQDVWMDAEEDIYTQAKTEACILEVEESLGSRTESEQEAKAGLEHEVEMAPKSKTEEEESQQKMHKTVERCETDSEGEDFAVAPEHPETETVSVTTME
ncbi:titin homolog [Cebidichthys violaceus]|uniref:titin homolog n=1 Tax=Cebidichthys violaceus TaxID=271503 RepID=UPI0035CC1340